MDNRTGEYENISQWIKADLARSSHALELLEAALFQPMEDEKNEKVPQTTAAEVLREYIKISREIQEILFSKISSHVLTIERLSDHILCRRAARERNKKNTTTTPKAPVAPTGMDMFSKFSEATRGMTIEQQEEFLRKIRGE